jgi:pyruvate-ferredoxin/flavodoxin oxidoreductase
MMVGAGDDLPVGAMPVDGTFPTGTACWEKRNLAAEIPVWESDLCIQCGKCVLVCPHAVIRHKVYEPAELATAPADFKSVPSRFKEFPGTQYTLRLMLEQGCKASTASCLLPQWSKTMERRRNRDAALSDQRCLG